jgi:hypothetical protein
MLYFLYFHFSLCREKLLFCTIPVSLKGKIFFYRSNADFAEVQFRRPQTNDGIKITSNAVFHAESESDLGFVVGSMVKELLGDN